MSTRDSQTLAEDGETNVKAASGMPLADLTLDAVVSGKVQPGDIAISAETLLQQARVARNAGRASLAGNFARAAELVNVPNEVIIETYEMLRPGRASSPEIILERARMLKDDYGATNIAAFLAEAAEIYSRRDLFRKRY